MKKLILILSAFLFSMSANATLLTVDLNQNNLQVGDTLTAQIIISDIEDDFVGFQKLLASFDMLMNFDSSLLAFSSITFGDKLDVDPDPFFASEQLFDNSVSGLLTFSEVAFAFYSDLFTAQDGLSQFVLASISFDVLASGNSQLDLANISLGDDFGDSFLSISSQSASFSVMSNNTPINVPEPASFALMFMGLLLLVNKRKV